MYNSKAGKIIYILSIIFAGMAELADALDSGSSGRPCRFKSCYPHQTKETPLVSFFVCIIIQDLNLMEAFCVKKTVL